MGIIICVAAAVFCAYKTSAAWFIGEHSRAVVWGVGACGWALAGLY